MTTQPNALDTMKYKHITSLLFLLSIVSLSSLNAQEKKEREYRISKSEFPQKALYSLGDLNQKRSLKFYKETDNDKVSYEAKFKYDKLYFSVEFDSSGALEDIEVLIKKRAFQKLKTESVYNFLTANYHKHKLLKIQLQYVVPNSTDDSTFINDVLINRTAFKHNYEIVAKVKAAKETILKEFVFGFNGQLLSERRINISSYDHVLY